MVNESSTALGSAALLDDSNGKRIKDYKIVKRYSDKGH